MGAKIFYIYAFNEVLGISKLKNYDKCTDNFLNSYLFHDITFDYKLLTFILLKRSIIESANKL